MLPTHRLRTTTTQSLISDAVFSETGPPRQVDIFALLWEYRHKVSFPTKQLLTTLRLSTCSFIHQATPLFGMITLTVFLNTSDVIARYAQCGHRTRNLAITIRCSNLLS